MKLGKICIVVAMVGAFKGHSYLSIFGSEVLQIERTVAMQDTFAL